jgi:hypothetical protein
MFLWIYEVSNLMMPVKKMVWLRVSSCEHTQLIGEGGPGEYFNLVGVVSHMFSTRTINWLVLLFLPVSAISFDVAGKALGNVLYPTQTQIHMEIESQLIAAKKKAAKETPPIASMNEP